MPTLASPEPYEVSFLLFAYNQAETVAAAVDAALAQEGAPLDIILSDDYSSDRTFAIMRDIAAAYTGPHRVRVRQSPANRGTISHVRDVVAEATGRLLVFAAGDDVSLPHRTATLAKAWRNAGHGPAALYSDYTPINELGEPVQLPVGYFFSGEHTLEGMAAGFIEAFGGSAAYTRDLFTHFPAIEADVVHEDRVLPFRALLLGGQVIPIEQKLVRYTVVGGISRQTLPTGMKDFALRFFPNQQRRLLGDARQRQRDIAARARTAIKVARLGQRTTATHETIIAMADRTGLGREAALLRGLLAGAHPAQTIKHYLKIRLPLPYRGQRRSGDAGAVS